MMPVIRRVRCAAGFGFAGGTILAATLFAAQPPGDASNSAKGLAAQLIADREAIQGLQQSAMKSATADLRKHGWQLFQKFTAAAGPSGKPLWLTWPSKRRTLHLAETGRTPLRQLVLEVVNEKLLPLDDPDYVNILHSPTVTLETVNYNPPAYAHIQEQQLYDPNAAAHLIASGARAVKDFPDPSVVIKAFWRILPADGVLRVGLWSWNDLPGDGSSAPEKNWGRHVCVALRPPAQADPACPYVSADQFYTLPVQNANEYSCFRCSIHPKNGDRLILVGMHIATKELPDWVWATFWWHGLDRTSGDDWQNDNAQMPDTLKKIWRNYSMDVSLGLRNRGNAPAQRATFNPYTEGASISTYSNCVQCHNQAVVPGNQPIYNYDFNFRDMEHHLQTDFLWTLAAVLSPALSNRAH